MVLTQTLSIIDPRSGEKMYCRGYASPASPSYDLPADAPRPSQEAPKDDEEIAWQPPQRQPSVPTRHTTTQAQTQQAPSSRQASAWRSRRR
jgi:hypothetical protein